MASAAARPRTCRLHRRCGALRAPARACASSPSPPPRSGKHGAAQRKWAAHHGAGAAPAGQPARGRGEGPATASNAAALSAAFEARRPQREYEYLLAHTREGEAAARCREETAQRYVRAGKRLSPLSVHFRA